jgi:hypothetical protein
MFLETDIYQPNGTAYRVTVADMTQIISWIPTIQAKMPPGSAWFPEVGHNGNGNIEVCCFASKHCALLTLFEGFE